jgi:hypothetical protein
MTADEYGKIELPALGQASDNTHLAESELNPYRGSGLARRPKPASQHLPVHN